VVAHRENGLLEGPPLDAFEKRRQLGF